jgi:HEAT repeat protein
MSVPQDKIVLLRSVIRGSPEEFAKRVQGLIEKLGANTFQDREAATRELIAMGPTVAPLLARSRDHSDPEVRERVRLVLERLGSEAPPAAGDDK